MKDISEYYSDVLMQKVMDVYKREIDLFGYNEGCPNHKIVMHRDVSSRCVTYDYLEDQLKFDS